jgi:hypothetical protein
MTIVLSIGAFINFLVIIRGVPYALGKERPSGSGGLIWWASVTLLVAVFALVSLVAAVGLASSTSTAAHLVLVLAVLFIVWMFFSRRAPSHGINSAS